MNGCSTKLVCSAIGNRALAPRASRQGTVWKAARVVDDDRLFDGDRVTPRLVREGSAAEEAHHDREHADHCRRISDPEHDHPLEDFNARLRDFLADSAEI